MFLVLVNTLVLSLSSFAAKPSSLQKAFPEGESLVFQKLSDSYTKRDLADVVDQEKILSKNFPNSVHRDQALYMRGYLELQKGRYAEALKAFGALDAKRPYSIKRPQALFAMAMTYKQLSLPRQADSVLARLQANYPGSVEAKRASLERRIIKVKR